MIGGVLNVVQRQRIPFGSGGPIAQLDLNFLSSTYLMGSGSYAFQDLIRFSRTSAGTFTGSNGLIQNSPISNNLMLWTEEIDNAAWTKVAAAVQSNLLLRSQEYDNASWVKNTSFIQTNLLTYSEEFDNAAWTKGNATVTANTTVAPDGTTTADTITGVTAGVSNFIRPTTLPTAVATQYTFSIWVKAGTATTCSLLLRDPIAGGGTNLPVTSQIVSGPGSISGSPIVNVTGLSTTEWTRVAITLVSPATAGNTLQPTFYPETALSATTALSNIIWGAQLIQGTAPGNYQRTEAAALAVAYTAPDGTLTADKLVVDSAAPFSSSYIRQNISKGATPLTYTTSVYAKAGELNQVRVVVRDNATSANGAGVAISLVDGSIVTAPYVVGTFTGPSAVVTNVGSGWYRIALTFTTSTETAIWAQTVFPQDSVVTTGDGASGIYVWGSQLVNGPVAETYQPTAASAIAIQHLAPNGVLSANKIVENGSSAFHYVREAVTAANGAHTFTVYLKAGERTRVIVSMSDITTGDAFIGVDLTNGTTFTATGLSVGSWTAISSSVTSVGSGWYRVRITATKGAGTQIAGSVFPTNGTSATFLGDGSSGFYMWGSQLEVGSSATSYSRNADGRYAPRFDYDPVTLEAKGLLIEEARTNLLTYSEQLDNAAWAKTRVTITANAIVAPDGTSTADKIVEDTTASNTHFISQSISYTAGIAYTLSLYIKAGERNWFDIQLPSSIMGTIRNAFFDVSSGTIGTVTSGVTAAIISVGNGWYRCSVTFTPTTSASASAAYLIADADNSISYTGDGTSGIYVWGTQIEAGAFVTSYIPTVASTVTRAADITLVTGGAFTPWYNPLAGTLSADVIPQVANPINQFVATINDGTAANRASIFKSSAGFSGFRVTTNSIATIPGSPVTAFTGGVTHKIALAFATGANNVNGALDGNLGTAVTLPVMPSPMNTLGIGINETLNLNWLNGHIRRVRYFNTRLTNAELQTVTT